MKFNSVKCVSKWDKLVTTLINKHRMYQYDSIICLLRSKNEKLKNDLNFYKSIFKTHGNSAVFNLRIKSINNKRLWVDKVKIHADYNLLNSLDIDNEVIEWKKPIKCER